jgi:hypothetical protein
MSRGRAGTVIALAMLAASLVPPASASQESAASLDTAESVTVGQIAPTSFKVSMTGSVEGPIGSALRHLLDGNASEAFARGAAPAQLMAKVNATLSSYCAASKCKDGSVSDDDVNRFSAEARRDAFLFELLRRAGVANLTVTVDGRGPTFEERLDFLVTGAAGRVGTILPVGVEYILNLHFGDAPADRFSLGARLDGYQPPRAVAFTLVAIPGYRLDSVSGLDFRTVREDWPDAGYTTLTGTLSDPGAGGSVVLVSGGLPTLCYAAVAAVVAACAAAMYLGWRRAKREERRRARAKKRAEQAAKAEAAGVAKPAGHGAEETELGKLERLREQSLITEEELRARSAEVLAGAQPEKKAREGSEPPT